MIALLVLQITALVAVGIIFAILFVLAYFDEHRTRRTESFLLGLAYGLTVCMVLATLYTISIPN